MNDLDDLLGAALESVLDQAPEPPTIADVHQRSRTLRQRRQALGIASIAAIVLVAGYVFASDDSSTITTTDVASTTTTTLMSTTTAPSSSLATPSSAIPMPSDQIRGVLPDGVEYQIRSEPALASEVEGISAGILINLDARENPEYGATLGIATFSRSSTRAGISEAGQMVVVKSGGWSMQIYVYDHILAELGESGLSTVFDAIVPLPPAPGSDLPSFELLPPLRWAEDYELPLQMAVQYRDFSVLRGCSDYAMACSDAGLVEVVPNEELFLPTAPWRANSVEVTANPGVVQAETGTTNVPESFRENSAWTVTEVSGFPEDHGKLPTLLLLRYFPEEDTFYVFTYRGCDAQFGWIDWTPDGQAVPREPEEDEVTTWGLLCFSGHNTNHPAIFHPGESIDIDHYTSGEDGLVRAVTRLEVGGSVEFEIVGDEITITRGQLSITGELVPESELIPRFRALTANGGTGGA